MAEWEVILTPTLPQASERKRLAGTRKKVQTKIVAICHLSGHESQNSYCGVADHVVPCYQRIMADVKELRSRLERKVYQHREETTKAAQYKRLLSNA